MTSGAPGLTGGPSQARSALTANAPFCGSSRRRCNGAAGCNAARPMHSCRSPRSSSSPGADDLGTAFDARHSPRLQRRAWRHLAYFRFPFCGCISRDRVSLWPHLFGAKALCMSDTSASFRKYHYGYIQRIRPRREETTFLKH